MNYAICFLLTFLCNVATAVFQEQIGEFDYIKENVGTIKKSIVSSSTPNDLYVVTNEGILANIDINTGDINWHSAKANNVFIDFVVGTKNIYELSFNRKSNGVSLSAWVKDSGRLLWESPYLNTDKNDDITITDIVLDESILQQVSVLYSNNVYIVSSAKGNIIWCINGATGIKSTDGLTPTFSKLLLPLAHDYHKTSLTDIVSSVAAVGCMVKSNSNDCSKTFIMQSNVGNNSSKVEMFSALPSVSAHNLRAAVSIKGDLANSNWQYDDIIFGVKADDSSVSVLQLSNSKVSTLEMRNVAAKKNVLHSTLLATTDGDVAPVIHGCSSSGCSSHVIAFDAKSSYKPLLQDIDELFFKDSYDAASNNSKIHLGHEHHSLYSSVSTSLSIVAIQSDMARSTTVDVSTSSVAISVTGNDRVTSINRSKDLFSFSNCAFNRISYSSVFTDKGNTVSFMVVVDDAGLAIMNDSRDKSIRWKRFEELSRVKQVVVVDHSHRFDLNDAPSAALLSDFNFRLKMQILELNEAADWIVSLLLEVPNWLIHTSNRMIDSLTASVHATLSPVTISAAKGVKPIDRRSIQRKQNTERVQRKVSSKAKRFGLDKVAVTLSSVITLHNDGKISPELSTFNAAIIRVTAIDLFTTSVLWSIEPALPTPIDAHADGIVLVKLVAMPKKSDLLTLIVSFKSGVTAFWTIDIAAVDGGASRTIMYPSLVLETIGQPVVSIFQAKADVSTTLYILVHSPRDDGSTFVTLYPPSCPTTFDGLEEEYVHILSQKELTTYRLTNHAVCNKDGTTSVTANKVSNMFIALDDEQVVAVDYPTSHDAIDRRFTVLGDDSILLKYINPHIVLAVTENPSSLSLKASLIDTVSGKIIYSTMHSDATGPVHAVIVENMCIYTYWNDNAKRTELSSIALYDGMIDKYGLNPLAAAKGSHVIQELQKESSYSAFSPQVPLGFQKTYVVPKVVTALHHTMTARGITNKHVLMGVAGGQVYAVDMRQIHPRRPFGPPSIYEKEEGLMQYNPYLQLMPTTAITYDYAMVGGVHTIVSTPSRLESTSLVLSFGGCDIHFNRVVPSQGFDLLSSDFNHVLLFSILVALAFFVLLLSRLSCKKALDLQWK